MSVLHQSSPPKSVHSANRKVSAVAWSLSWELSHPDELKLWVSVFTEAVEGTGMIKTKYIEKNDFSMWNFCLCTKKLHVLLHELLPSFRAKYCYLFVCLFILCQFVIRQHIPWDTQIILFSLDHSGLPEEGVPFSRPAAPHTWWSFLYSMLVYFYSPQLSSTPRWDLLQLPAQFHLALHTQVLLCCWKIFSFPFLTCVQKILSPPSGYASGTVVSQGARKAFL